MEAKPTFNPEIPSIARTYDYLLGGKDNYPVDREIGEIFIKKFPGAVQIALDNRACLVRAVTFIAGELGISQFIDLGSGLPTADNVHQVAQRADPGATVVYVDNDPIVLAHGRAMLAEDDQTVVVKADIRQPAQILSDAGGPRPDRLRPPGRRHRERGLAPPAGRGGPARGHPRHVRRGAPRGAACSSRTSAPWATRTPPRLKRSCSRRSAAACGAPASRSGSSSVTCGSPRRESCRAPGGARRAIPATCPYTRS